MAVDGRVLFLHCLAGRLLRSFKVCAQVDTSLLEDVHGEADKTKKKKARSCCVGAGADMLRQCKGSVSGDEASCDLCGVEWRRTVGFLANPSAGCLAMVARRWVQHR